MRRGTTFKVFKSVVEVVSDDQRLLRSARTACAGGV